MRGENRETFSRKLKLEAVRLMEAGKKTPAVLARRNEELNLNHILLGKVTYTRKREGFAYKN